MKHQPSTSGSVEETVVHLTQRLERRDQEYNDLRRVCEFQRTSHEIFAFIFIDSYSTGLVEHPSDPTGVLSSIAHLTPPDTDSPHTSPITFTATT